MINISTYSLCDFTNEDQNIVTESAIIPFQYLDAVKAPAISFVDASGLTEKSSVLVMQSLKCDNFLSIVKKLHDFQATAFVRSHDFLITVFLRLPRAINFKQYTKLGNDIKALILPDFDVIKPDVIHVTSSFNNMVFVGGGV